MRQLAVKPDQTFGMVTILERIADVGGSGVGARYRVRCACGVEFEATGYRVRSGETPSCGCRRRALASINSKTRTHGMTSTPTWRSWSSMIRRCYTPSETSFRYYGARGITVCERWLGRDGFAHFLADMGERPSGMTLDRYHDNDGNYEPSNCRWATPKQQATTRRPPSRRRKACQLTL